MEKKIELIAETVLLVTSITGTILVFVVEGSMFDFGLWLFCGSIIIIWAVWFVKRFGNAAAKEKEQ